MKVLMVLWTIRVGQGNKRGYENLTVVYVLLLRKATRINTSLFIFKEPMFPES